jgi:hypothetical protein
MPAPRYPSPIVVTASRSGRSQAKPNTCESPTLRTVRQQLRLVRPASHRRTSSAEITNEPALIRNVADPPADTRTTSASGPRANASPTNAAAARISEDTITSRRSNRSPAAPINGPSATLKSGLSWRLLRPHAERAILCLSRSGIDPSGSVFLLDNDFEYLLHELRKFC